MHSMHLKLIVVLSKFFEIIFQLKTNKKMMLILGEIQWYFGRGWFFRENQKRFFSKKLQCRGEWASKENENFKNVQIKTKFSWILIKNVNWNCLEKSNCQLEIEFNTFNRQNLSRENPKELFGTSNWKINVINQNLSQSELNVFQFQWNNLLSTIHHHVNIPFIFCVPSPKS